MRVLTSLLVVLSIAGCTQSTPTQTVTDLTGFTSADANIGCYIDPNSVRCDVAKPGWKAPEPPADCTLDYGKGIELSAGGDAHFVCASDSTLHSGTPLPLGQAIRAGTLTCTNRLERFTCMDSNSGHGFMISSGAYKLY